MGKRLLPQPGGLEGVRLAHVQLHLDHQPVPERGDPRELPKGHLDIRVAPAHPQVEQDDSEASNSISGCQSSAILEIAASWSNSSLVTKRAFSSIDARIRSTFPFDIARAVSRYGACSQANSAGPGRIDQTPVQKPGGVTARWLCGRLPVPRNKARIKETRESEHPQGLSGNPRQLERLPPRLLLLCQDHQRPDAG